MKAPARMNQMIDDVLETTIVGSFTNFGYFVRSRTQGWTPSTGAAGRTVVITGATSGLGLAMAEQLAREGAHVHLVGRSPDKLAGALKIVRREALATVSAHRCDLSLLHDTHALAKELHAFAAPIDVLVHNAGALLAAYTTTTEHVETTLAVHLLSPFYLTQQLIRSESFAPHARVITMTSGGMYTEPFNLATLEVHRTDYKGTVAYARSKRAQTILTGYWQQTYGPAGLAFHLVHPGWAHTPGVSSGIPGFATIMGPLLRSPEQGADTALWLAGLPDDEPGPGQLWFDRRARSLYRLRKTRLSAHEETTAQQQLAAWCEERVTTILRAHE